jgi:hypothetical protein
MGISKSRGGRVRAAIEEIDDHAQTSRALTTEISDLAVALLNLASANRPPEPSCAGRRPGGIGRDAADDEHRG